MHDYAIDHSESEMAVQSSIDSYESSVSTELDDDESDLDSMTGKGIKHLCSELLELKLVSNQEFHKNIFSNYRAFIRIFEEAENLGNEIMQLKTHILTQKSHVKDLIDIVESNSCFEEGMDSIVDEFISEETLPLSELDEHISNVSEIMDILVLENKIDEALDLIESEDENLQSMKFEDTCSLNDLRLLNAANSKNKARLKMKLTELAENRRISSSELQKALFALCQLGETDLATELMLEHYHARIETGIQYLQRTRSISNGVYPRELAKLVFSMISQAAKSFVMLFGENSSFETELLPWAKGETKVYVNHFNDYLNSVLEIPLGLLVQAVEVSVSFCSLLENQRLVLKPYLVKHVWHSIKVFLHAHVEHLKKDVAGFAASDSWFPHRYILSELINERSFSMCVEVATEYCVLTSSGREFLILIQTIAENVAPLFTLQMEGLIFGGIVNLLKEYVINLEKALVNDSDFTEPGNSTTKSAVSLQQQISIIANLSTLASTLPRFFMYINRRTDKINSGFINGDTISNQQKKKTDSFTLFAKEAFSQLRVRYFQRYIRAIMSPETSNNFRVDHDGMPSVTFQKLFLELRKIERLAEDIVFEKEWLLDILRELIEAVFSWILTNKDMWITTDSSTIENSFNYKQFALDVQFLVEIAKYGGYFFSNPSVLMDLMKSTCLSAGLSLKRDSIDIRDAPDCANEVIKHLLEIEKTTEVLPNEMSIRDDPTTFSEDSMGSDATEIVTVAETSSLNAYSSPRGGSQSDSDDYGDDINSTIVYARMS